ncbi:MAG: flagellar biosynthetic protein FliQ [Rhodovarius sp.]|nr:flagellar biosynthetic protein FliQ [Rhodovarius sp.]MCX7933061.1 flagellar biosynthetic protein FliQ [Rhodovarius sp.]MDW8314223.1 flagellar biosynthetic protein FliQ [Rhodovarius sp.]
MEHASALALGQALWVSLQLAGPPLLALLLIGLVISLLQALTQVQEATLAFLPKLLALGAMLLWLGPFMTRVLQGWAQQLFDQAVAVGGWR